MKPQGYIQNNQRTKIIKTLENLLEKPPDNTPKKLYTFYKRICR